MPIGKTGTDVGVTSVSTFAVFDSWAKEPENLSIYWAHLASTSATLNSASMPFKLRALFRMSKHNGAQVLERSWRRRDAKHESLTRDARKAPGALELNQYGSVSINSNQRLRQIN